MPYEEIARENTRRGGTGNNYIPFFLQVSNPLQARRLAVHSIRYTWLTLSLARVRLPVRMGEGAYPTSASPRREVAQASAAAERRSVGQNEKKKGFLLICLRLPQRAFGQTGFFFFPSHYSIVRRQHVLPLRGPPSLFDFYASAFIVPVMRRFGQPINERRFTTALEQASPAVYNTH